MRKNNRVLGTRDMLKLAGIRKGVVAFFVSMVVGIMLMWLSVVGMVGVSICLICGIVMFLILARKDVMEQRKLNKESGVRRI